MSVALVLNNLRAEGGPALAADLAAEWLERRPVVLSLNDESMEYAPRFDSIGVPIEVLGVGPVSPRRSVDIATRVAFVLKKHRASAIVSIPNGIHGAIFAGAKLAGVYRRVVHVGNYPWHWHPGFWKYRMLMRLSAPLTPDLVCVTNHVAEGVKTHFGWVGRRMHVIPNGIDLVRFAYRGLAAPVSGRPIEIIMVGRLDSGKDHNALIEAIEILLCRGVALRLSIVGEGALRDQIERRTGGLGTAVRFLGARRDVPELLASADVFAFAVQPEEGLGIALLEAMAVGIPIVATDVGACREVLDGGRCGALVPPGDPDALAEALLTAANAPNFGYIQNARTRVEMVYSRAAMANAYGALCGFE